MRYLYSAGMVLYNWLLLVASVFNSKAAMIIRGRKESISRVRDAFNEGDRIFWFHCASLGEFEQGRPVMEKIKEEQSDIKILLTFYSPSGYEVRKDYRHADCVAYLPADKPGKASRFISAVNPEKAVFIKYEFWYNYLRLLQGKGIPVYLISGIFRPSQPFFRWYGKYFLRILRGISHFYVQDKDSALLLEIHGIDNYTISGDTRFDRVMAISMKADRNEIISEFKTDGRLIVGGSTWQAEEEMIARYMESADHNTKYIIAPHDISPANISRILKLFSPYAARYSTLNDKPGKDFGVIIIDSIGLLSSVYRYADIAVIGGGFGRGIHNILEAATWSVPVLFGPNYRKFREAHDLIMLGGAKTFKNYVEFKSLIDDLLDMNTKLESCGKTNLEYVRSNCGATDLIITKLLTKPG